MTKIADWQATSAARVENLVNDKLLSRGHSGSKLISRGCSVCDWPKYSLRTHHRQITRQWKWGNVSHAACRLEKVNTLLGVAALALKDLSYYKVGSSSHPLSNSKDSICNIVRWWDKAPKEEPILTLAISQSLAVQPLKWMLDSILSQQSCLCWHTCSHEAYLIIFTSWTSELLYLLAFFLIPQNSSNLSLHMQVWQTLTQ